MLKFVTNCRNGGLLNAKLKCVEILLFKAFVLFVLLVRFLGVCLNDGNTGDYKKLNEESCLSNEETNFDK